MTLLRDEDVAFLRERFAELAHPVTLSVVTREKSRLILPGAEPDEEGPDASAEVRQLLGEVAATSPHLVLEEVAAGGDRALALGGELVPAIHFSSAKAKGKLRYFGLPAGYEMSTVVATIADLGGPEELVPPEVAERLAALATDVHIQVFVTPS